MVRQCLLGTILLTLSSTVPATASETNKVWYWFGSCSGPSMKIEIRANKKVVHSTIVPICNGERGSGHDGASRRLPFTFKLQKAINWSGEREEKPAEGSQEVGGEIWLAQSDPDSLTLGVSFESGGITRLNSLHIAYPDQKQVSEVVDTLVFSTEPVKLSKKSKKKK